MASGEKGDDAKFAKKEEAKKRLEVLELYNEMVGLTVCETNDDNEKCFPVSKITKAAKDLKKKLARIGTTKSKPRLCLYGYDSYPYSSMSESEIGFGG